MLGKPKELEGRNEQSLRRTEELFKHELIWCVDYNVVLGLLGGARRHCGYTNRERMS